MDGLIARTQRAVRAFIEEPAQEPAVRRMPAFIPHQNPLESEPGAGARQQAALRMMDPDCYGFLLITIHREVIGPRAAIEIAEHLDGSWLPAVATTLERVADEFEAIS